MRNTGNSVACSRRVTTPRWHLIILFSPLVDTNMSLACQIIVAPLNASKKRAIMLKMFSTVCRLNIGMATRCRLDKTSLTQMQMCMSKNELLWCVLPSPTTKNAQTDRCSNLFAILFKLVATKTWTYWLTLWLLMPLSFCTLRRSFAWQIEVAVYRNNMPHPT
jgi:hypothetical protein